MLKTLSVEPIVLKPKDINVTYILQKIPRRSKDKEIVLAKFLYVFITH